MVVPKSDTQRRGTRSCRESLRTRSEVICVRACVLTTTTWQSVCSLPHEHVVKSKYETLLASGGWGLEARTATLRGRVWSQVDAWGLPGAGRSRSGSGQGVLLVEDTMTRTFEPGAFNKAAINFAIHRTMILEPCISVGECGSKDWPDGVARFADLMAIPSSRRSQDDPGVV
jgi:hypothetical protein